MNGGNTTTLQNCYVHNVAAGKVGYKLWSGGVLISCNGLDSGDYWGEFGANNDEDGFVSQYQVTLINCNIEDFAKIGTRFKYNGKVEAIKSTWAAPSSGTYQYYVKIDYTTEANWFWDCNFASKGATLDSGSLASFYGEKMIFLEGGDFPATERELEFSGNVHTTPSVGYDNSSYLKGAFAISRAYLQDIDYMKLGGKRHHYGTAAPTSGDWEQGDIVWNTAPSAGGPPGWMCVTSGSPGTWKAMANLAA